MLLKYIFKIIEIRNLKKNEYLTILICFTFFYYYFFRCCFHLLFTLKLIYHFSHDEVVNTS